MLWVTMYTIAGGMVEKSGKILAKTVKIDDFRFFLGGGGLFKDLRTWDFLNGQTYCDDGGSNVVSRLSLRFFVVRKGKVRKLAKSTNF